MKSLLCKKCLFSHYRLPSVWIARTRSTEKLLGNFRVKVIVRLVMDCFRNYLRFAAKISLFKIICQFMVK